VTKTEAEQKAKSHAAAIHELQERLKAEVEARAKAERETQAQVQETSQGGIKG